jgi:hypothetical protein
MVKRKHNILIYEYNGDSIRPDYLCVLFVRRWMSASALNDVRIEFNRGERGGENSTSRLPVKFSVSVPV